MTVQKMSHNLWRKPVSATGAKQLLKVPLLPSSHTIIHPNAHVTNSATVISPSGVNHCRNTHLKVRESPIHYRGGGGGGALRI